MEKLLAVCLLIFAVGASAGHYLETAQVRRAVYAGHVVAYAEIEKTVNKLLKARIIRVDLGEDDGVWVYELRLLADDGRIVELALDAQSLQVLKLEGVHLETIIRFP